MATGRATTKEPGVRGFGRLGADFWPVLENRSGHNRGTLCGIYPESAWGQLRLCFATAYVLARPGRNYVAYTYQRTPGQMIGLKHMTPGTYRFNWLDTVTGKTAAETKNVAAGDQAWPVPAGFGNEVAVHVAIQSGERE